MTTMKPLGVSPDKVGQRVCYCGTDGSVFEELRSKFGTVTAIDSVDDARPFATLATVQFDGEALPRRSYITNFMRVAEGR